MKIIINGEKIAYTLADEQNIAQVLQQLEQWLQGQGATLTEVYLNEERCECVPADWPQQPLEQIWKVELCAQTYTDTLLSQLQSLAEFCADFAQSLPGKQARKYVNEWPQIEPRLIKIMPSYPFTLLNSLLEDAQDALRSQALKEELLSIGQHLQNFALLLQDEAAYAAHLRRTLTRLSPALQQAGELLQQQGHSTLLKLVQQLLSWFADLELFARRESKCLDFYQQIFSKLQQLEQAMADADWVLVADLIEYEIFPNLEPINQLLESKNPSPASSQTNSDQQHDFV